MSKKLINRLMLMAVVAGSVAACSSGTGSSSNSNPSVQEAPAGPVLYSRVQDRYSQLRMESGGTVSLSMVGDPKKPDPVTLLGIEVAPELVVVYDIGKYAYSAYELYSFLKPDNSPTMQDLMDRMDEMQKEIDQINANMLSAENIFYGYTREVAQASTKTAETAYYAGGQGINEFNGPRGAYPKFENLMAQYDNNLEQVALSPEAMQTLNVDTLGLQSDLHWNEFMTNISTSTTAVQCGDDCYKTVAATSVNSTKIPSTTLNLYAAYAEQLKWTLPYGLESSVPVSASEMFESYNQAVIGIYLSNVTALEQSYVYEATVNALNYLNAINYINTGNSALFYQIGNNLEGGGASGVFYSYRQDANSTVAAEKAKLLKAQEQLALLFAARANVLVDSTMRAIVSDSSFDNFIWPTPPEVSNKLITLEMSSHPYSQMLAKTLKTSDFMVSGLGNLIPQVVGVESQIFYQYSGFGQYYQCAEAMYQGESLNSSNCPPIYTNPINQSVYDGTHFNVALKVESGFVYSNLLDLSYCDNNAATVVTEGRTFGVEAGIWCPVSTLQLDRGRFAPASSAFPPVQIRESYAVSTLYSIPMETQLLFGGATDFESVTSGALPPSYNYIYGDGVITHEFSSKTNVLTMSLADTIGYSNSAINPFVGSFSSAFSFTLASGYSGMLYIMGETTSSAMVSEGARNSYWNFYATCGINDALCVPYNGGLCVNGTPIEFSVLPKYGASANIYAIEVEGASC